MRRAIALCLLFAWLAFAQTYNHVTMLGQSNCLGFGANQVSPTQPYHNLQAAYGGSTLSALQAVQGSSPPADEPPMVSIGNQLTSLSGGSSGIRMVMDESACSNGAAYGSLKKGATQYNTNWLPYITGSSTIKGSIVAAGFTYNPLAMVIKHGEADFGSSVSVYKADLLQWIGNVNSDLNLGNGSNVGAQYPAFINPFAAWNNCAGACMSLHTPTTTDYGSIGSTPVAALQICREQPFRAICSPGYQFTYDPTVISGKPDLVHLDSGGEVGMGSLIGDQIYDWMANNQRVLMVDYKKVSISGSTITAKMHVAHPPLVIDTTTIPASVNGVDGFEWCDGSNYANQCHSGSSSTTITSVTVSASDTLTIGLSGTPSCPCILNYAWTSGALDTALNDMARGNIRDSDSRTSWYTGSLSTQDTHLYNWMMGANEITFASNSSVYIFDPFNTLGLVQ